MEHSVIKNGSHMHKVRRIFVVDDEPDNRFYPQNILDMNGYSARSFTYPREVVGAASVRPP
jgi:CheY-like chemotaxis protein